MVNPTPDAHLAYCRRHSSQCKVTLLGKWAMLNLCRLFSTSDITASSTSQLRPEVAAPRHMVLVALTMSTGPWQQIRCSPLHKHCHRLSSCRLPRVDYSSGAGGAAVEAALYHTSMPSLAYVPVYSSALPPTGGQRLTVASIRSVVLPASVCMPHSLPLTHLLAHLHFARHTVLDGKFWLVDMSCGTLPFWVTSASRHARVLHHQAAASTSLPKLC